MRKRTLEQNEALAFLETSPANLKTPVKLTIKEPLVWRDGLFYFADSWGNFLAREEVEEMIRKGAATIEVTEHDIFDDPAFDNWEILSQETCAARGNFHIYADGRMRHCNQPVRTVNPSDIPALAAAVNRLVEVGEVSE